MVVGGKDGYVGRDGKLARGRDAPVGRVGGGGVGCPSRRPSRSCRAPGAPLLALEPFREGHPTTPTDRLRQRNKRESHSLVF